MGNRYKGLEVPDKHTTEKMVLRHPPDMHPEDYLRFVLLPSFEKGWKKLDLTDEDLRALQMCIMAAPAGAPVIPRTGGLRKLRFSPERWKVGKSGAARICYAYFPSVSVVVLVIIYAKKKKDNLTGKEKAAFKRVLERLERTLNKERSETGSSDV